MASIQIVPLRFGDWVVREEGGPEFGHYSSQAEAEAIGRPLARKRNCGLVVHRAGGGISIRDRCKAWFRQLFGR
jgi:Uncharacterized protein conserved in bacteria (DUF2188)